MSIPARVMLTPNAAQRTATVVKQALSTPIDMRGRRGPSPVNSVNLIAVVPSSYIGGGVYNGNYSTGSATGYNATAGTIAGLTLGAAVLIFDSPNFGSNGSYGALHTPMVAPLIGFKFGVDSVTGKDMIAVSGAFKGC